ncbi:hypothetical protein K227x_61980 [Rubripirellula lacrimiformis]|uniref:Uncharacterized protein n=2 Tax=Rubripirellula lacrimiformis TaxID=1930273 RepID=A0A517NKW3_9BACT|nr:hypothetical protein K227x_61980 [Rubripirellula lacrimiformis]
MIRSCLVLSVFLLAPNLLTADSSVSSDSESAWITIQKVPGQTSDRNEYHLRVTGNTDPKFLRLTGAPLHRFKSAKFYLKSYEDADLRFRSNDFLVLKIKGSSVVSAVAKDFPDSLAISLAKVFQANGYQVENVEPKMLLHRNEQQSPSAAEFVIPDSPHASKR